MRALALAALVSLAAPAHAHDLWIERAGDAFLVRRGHRGGELLPLDRSKLAALRCADGRGGQVDLLGRATFTATEVRVPGACAALSATYRGGFYSLTPDGERNLPKDQVPDAVKAWASREYAKWVEPGLAREVLIGDELELAPDGDLGAVQPGDKIAWRVLLAGAPVAGAVVSLDHRAIGVSDTAGVVRVRVREVGLQVVDATLRRKVATPQADELVLSASIAVEVGR